MKVTLLELRLLIIEELKKFDINKLKSSKDPIRYIKSKCTIVGEGGGRIVYSTMTGFVVKIAKGPSGIKSNKNETRKSRKAPAHIVNKIIDHDPMFVWVLARFATPFKDEETLDSWIRDTTDGTINSLKDLKRNLYRVINGDYTVVKNNEWFSDLVILCRDVGMSPSELHVENWGLLNGNLIVLDVE